MCRVENCVGKRSCALITIAKRFERTGEDVSLITSSTLVNLCEFSLPEFKYHLHRIIPTSTKNPPDPHDTLIFPHLQQNDKDDTPTF